MSRLIRHNAFEWLVLGAFAALVGLGLARFDAWHQQGLGQWLLLLLASSLLLAVFVSLYRIHRQHSGSSEPHMTQIEVAGTTLIAHWSDQRSQSIQISDLRRVCVWTSDAGPIGDDIFWQLGLADGSSLMFAQSIPGQMAAMELLQTLPGFSNEAVVAAMGSTDFAQFVCWEGSETAAPSANV